MSAPLYRELALSLRDEGLCGRAIHRPLQLEPPLSDYSA